MPRVFKVINLTINSKYSSHSSYLTFNSKNSSHFLYMLPPSQPSPTGEGVHISIFQDALSISPLGETGKGVKRLFLSYMCSRILIILLMTSTSTTFLRNSEMPAFPPILIPSFRKLIPLSIVFLPVR